MVTNRTGGRRSRDLAIQSECVKFQQSDGDETVKVKLGSNELQQSQLTVVRDEGVLNYWLKCCRCSWTWRKDSFSRWMRKN